ncbi:MAG: carbohydrate kinase family protein [Vicinamibacterales bacterium]
MLDVVGFGENSVDLVYQLPELPRGGAAKLPVIGRQMLPGGQVATTMAACAALGLRAGYVGSFGDDDAGALARVELARRGVDIAHAIVRDAPNRHAIILVDRAGERSILWSRDAALIVRPGDVRAAWIADAGAVHVDAVDEDASIALAQMARRAGLPVTSDIDTVTSQTAALVAAVTVPILAEGIAEALTGERDAEAALRALRRTHDGLLVVTLGARGSMMLEGDQLHVEPAFTAQAVDTTGAGDIFRAGFIYGMRRGLRGRDLLRVANAAAAVSCTRTGAMTSAPSLNEVEALLASRF